jgi:hypothetical protein
MFSIPRPKYKFKEDFTAKLCKDFIESFTNKTPCKSYEDLAFKKGNVFEAVKNVNNTDPNKIFGMAKMTPFEVPLNVLEKVDDSTPITDIIQGDPIVNKKKKQEATYKEDKKTKMMFIIPTIVILSVIWIYGIKKL